MLMRKIMVTLIGLALTLMGTLLLVLPGPGSIVLFFGLSLLGTEYTWANKLRRMCRRGFHRCSVWFNAKMSRLRHKMSR